MIFVKIRFNSIDGLESGFLTYALHDHSIAQRWKTVVEKSLKLGSTYNPVDCFYGKGFDSLEDIERKIYASLDEIKKEIPELTIKTPFIMNQHNLNLAHVIFEQGIHEMSEVRKIRENPVFFYLYQLNTSIHRMEAELSGIEGFFIDTRLFDSFKNTIKSHENKLFSLDRKWGELYLNYCHVGESYLNIMYNSYPQKAVPQTDISGSMILQFQSDYLYQDHLKLQEWMDEYIGHKVNLSDYPIGLVPLGHLTSQWTKKNVEEFFKNFPVLDGMIEFEEQI